MSLGCWRQHGHGKASPLTAIDMFLWETPAHQHRLCASSGFTLVELSCFLLLILLENHPVLVWRAIRTAHDSRPWIGAPPGPFTDLVHLHSKGPFLLVAQIDLFRLISATTGLIFGNTSAWSKNKNFSLPYFSFLKSSEMPAWRGVWAVVLPNVLWYSPRVVKDDAIILCRPWCGYRVLSLPIMWEGKLVICASKPKMFLMLFHLYRHVQRKQASLFQGFVSHVVIARMSKRVPCPPSLFFFWVVYRVAYVVITLWVHYSHQHNKSLYWKVLA